jgi:hypothetical protein
LDFVRRCRVNNLHYKTGILICDIFWLNHVSLVAAGVRASFGGARVFIAIKRMSRQKNKPIH